MCSIIAYYIGTYIEKRKFLVNHNTQIAVTADCHKDTYLMSFFIAKFCLGTNIPSICNIHLGLGMLILLSSCAELSKIRKSWDRCYDF
jgi:tetrahydromethanopterin S-methyltransferase subunit C